MNTRVAAVIFSVILTVSPLAAGAHSLNPKVIEKLTGENITEHTEATTTDPRGEERTFASFPEWYIVYSAEEYADFVQGGGRPSQFPYLTATRQYWDSVEYSKQALGETPIDPNTNTVLTFIGASFTFENALIGLYENTIGLLSEASNFFRKSSADAYIDGVAQEYADFLLHTPWYDFPYFSKIPGLWRGMANDLSPRAFERRAIFTVGYLIKGAYGKVIGKASHASLGIAVLETTFTTDSISADALSAVSGVTIIEVYDDGHVKASAPRYRAFKPVAEAIARAGGIFLEIQENDEIMLTLVAPTDAACLTSRSDILFSQPITTKQNTSRFAFKTAVPQLASALRDLESCKLKAEHIYDY